MVEIEIRRLVYEVLNFPSLLLPESTTTILRTNTFQELTICLEIGSFYNFLRDKQVKKFNFGSREIDFQLFQQNMPFLVTV